MGDFGKKRDDWSYALKIGASRSKQQSWNTSASKLPIVVKCTKSYPSAYSEPC